MKPFINTEVILRYNIDVPKNGTIDHITEII